MWVGQLCSTFFTGIMNNPGEEGSLGAWREGAVRGGVVGVGRGRGGTGWPLVLLFGAGCSGGCCG